MYILMCCITSIFTQETVRADVGFQDSKYFIKVEVKWNTNGEDDQDSFHFTLSNSLNSINLLNINFKEISRANLEASLLGLRMRSWLLDEPSAENKKRHALFQEIEDMLQSSFVSRFMILEYTAELLELIRNIDPENCVTEDEVLKILNPPTEPEILK